MFYKAFISLLATSATVLAIALPGEDDNSSSVQKQDYDENYTTSSRYYDSGHGATTTTTKTVTVTGKGHTQWKTRTIWSTTTSTRRAAPSTTTVQADPVTRTIRADPVTRTVTVNARPGAASPQVLNVRLHPSANCAANGVPREGSQVEYSEVAIPFPFARADRGAQAGQSSCSNTPNDFFSLSFESFFGQRGLSGCKVQIFDNQNCQGGSLLRSIGIGNNERECYATVDDGGYNNGRTASGNKKGNDGKQDDDKETSSGAQSLRLVCKD